MPTVTRSRTTVSTTDHSAVLGEIAAATASHPQTLTALQHAKETILAQQVGMTELRESTARDLDAMQGQLDTATAALAKAEKDHAAVLASREKEHSTAMRDAEKAHVAELKEATARHTALDKEWSAKYASGMKDLRAELSASAGQALDKLKGEHAAALEALRVSSEQRLSEWMEKAGKAAKESDEWRAKYEEILGRHKKVIGVIG